VDKSLFDDLIESVRQMDAIARGARKPSRTRVVDAGIEVKAIRAKPGCRKRSSRDSWTESGRNLDGRNLDTHSLTGLPEQGD